MSVCRVYRLRYSEFLEWSLDDQHAAVMHELRRGQRCTGCGTHPDDWDPELGGSVDAYVVEEEMCRGCAALEKGRAELEIAREHGRVRPGTTARLRPYNPDEDEDDPEADRG